MPLLPQIEVTTPQWNRLKSVLEGDTVEEKTATYEQICLTALAEYTRTRRRQMIFEEHQAALEAALALEDENPDNLLPPVPAP